MKVAFPKITTIRRFSLMSSDIKPLQKHTHAVINVFAELTIHSRADILGINGTYMARHRWIYC